MTSPCRSSRRRLRPSRLAPVAVLFGAIFAAGLLEPISALGASPTTARVVVAVSTAIPKGARALGPVDTRRSIELDLLLNASSASPLVQRAAAQRNPGSSAYHHYLSPAAFARRFGASPSVVERLTNGLRHLGIDSATLSSDRLFLRVRAPAWRIERAFSTKLARFRVGTSTTTIANTTPASLPRALASLVSTVVGLDGFGAETANMSVARLVAPPRHKATSRSALTEPTPGRACGAEIGANAFFPAAVTTTELASAYRFTGLYQNGDYGAGKTVALIEFGPYIKTDIAAFEACYHLSQSSTPHAPRITEIPVDEHRLMAATRSGPTAANEVETELDLETLIGLAPEANIDVYEAPNPNINAEALDAYIKAVDNPAVSVISTSWGDCEAQLGIAQIEAESAVFRQAAIEGKTIVAAAGDEGSTDCFGSLSGPQAHALAVDDPASQPYVTGVGGTQFNSLGPPPNEQAWNAGRSGAGGGGVSGIWAMPPYQTNSPPSLHVVSAQSICPTHASNCREVPDVAGDAGTPLEIYCTQSGASGCSNGWSAVGGTSLAAPLWAALFTLADASAACHNVRIGFANPALYTIAGSSGGPSAFNEITSGSNNIGFRPGRYEAGPGYNLVTGLGTPIAGNGADNGLVAQLCASVRPSSFPGSVSVPYVRAVRPRSGRASGGRRVTIIGSDLSGVSEVAFGATPAHVVFAGPSTIIAIAPRGVGTVSVRLRSPVGWSWRLPATAFHYLSEPHVSVVLNDSGPPSGGTAVTLEGSGFVGVRSVRFGASSARFSVISPTKILAISPPGALDSNVSIVVSAPGGASTQSSAAIFRYR